MSKNVFKSALICTGIALCLGTSFASADARSAGEVGRLVAAPQADNPFEGAWAGTFVNTATGVGGTLEWTIEEHGRLEGSYLFDSGAAGKLVGVAFASGVLHVGAAPGAGFLGAAILDANGNMIVVAVNLGSGAILAIELAPQ